MVYLKHLSTLSTRLHWIAQLEEESLLISKVKASLSSLFRNQGAPIPLNLIQTYTDSQSTYTDLQSTYTDLQSNKIVNVSN